MKKYVGHTFTTHFLRRYGTKASSQETTDVKTFPKVDIAEYILANLSSVKSNLKLRKESQHYDHIIREIELHSENEEKVNELALALPNDIHPAIRNFSTDYNIVKMFGEKKTFDFEPVNATELLREKDLLKTDHLVKFCGDRSYHMAGQLARLETALIRFTLEKLIRDGFQLVLVPDILNEKLVESCGMNTKGERTQIYRLNPDLYGDGWCLSGTSEMALAGFLMNRNLKESELPMKLVACSRCYRAEVSNIAIEKGLYRVHQFNKVEMFAACLPYQSQSLLESFISFQENVCQEFDLHYRILDMAPHELGRQAYRKYDVEVWMPGLGIFGEVSSCSNCTDYQSRRLNIKSENTFLHTVNGTACATPRIISGIVETHQTSQGRVTLPRVLQCYTGFDVLGMKRGPRLTIEKNLPKKMTE